MDIMVVSRSFPDEKADRMRERYGIKLITPRSIEAAQRKIEDFDPDVLIIENALDGAQFFAKAVKYEIKDRCGKDVSVFMAIKGDIPEEFDPEEYGVDGFMPAPLIEQSIVEACELVPVATEETDEPPGQEPRTEVEGQSDAETGEMERAKTRKGPEPAVARKNEVESKTRTTRAAHAEDAPPRSSDNKRREKDELKKLDKKLPYSYKLAFPAVLGVIILVAALYGPAMINKDNNPAVNRVVPNLYGTNEDSAMALLDAEGLECVVEYAPSDEEDGRVISQEPAAGTDISEVDLVTVIVSETTEEDHGETDEIARGQVGVEDGGGEEEANAPPGTQPSPAPQPQERPAPQPAPAPQPSPQPAPAPASGSSPVARISASSTSVKSGTFVSFSASGSYDPDGGLLTYSWSIGGSGVSVSREMVSNVVPGSVIVSVTVTDSEGKSSSASVSVSIY